jgi:hypothetical protein
VGRVGFALAPLVERLKHLLRQQNMLHADETPVAQLDPGQGKTKRAYLWAYRSVDSPHSNAPRIVVFDYQSGRAGKHAANFLQDWKGEPKLAQLLDWLSQTLQSSAPNSAIARATSYTLKRWSALTRYADNGQRPIGRVEMWPNKCATNSVKIYGGCASKSMNRFAHPWLLKKFCVVILRLPP